MAFNFNKAIIGGRLTATPELKQTASGIFVTSFTIAVSRRAKHDETDFLSCSAWRQTAEFICKNFEKGSPICVVGQVQTKKWTDAQGAPRSITEIVVDDVHYVESRRVQMTEQEDQNEPQEAQETRDSVVPNFNVLAQDQDLPF